MLTISRALTVWVVLTCRLAPVCINADICNIVRPTHDDVGIQFCSLAPAGGQQGGHTHSATLLTHFDHVKGGRHAAKSGSVLLSCLVPFVYTFPTMKGESPATVYLSSRLV